jgi:GMP synthase-like glutamine amidotransferase
VNLPRLLVIEPSSSDPVERLGQWLTDAGLDLDVRGPTTLPDDLSGYAGLVVLGGPMGANDDARAPWLASVRALLRAAVADELPTLGICLGAQLLAAANGGRVGRNPGGPEYGALLIAKRAAAAGDPLFGPLPITPDVIQWHVDAVLDLPPGAQQLASSPVCENQAYRLGRLAWGVQFHIETLPARVRGWAAADSAALDGYDVDAILARADAAHDDIAEVWQPFAAAFAGIVADPSAVPAARAPLVRTAEPITDPAAIRAALAAEAAAARSPHQAAAPARHDGVARLPMPGARPVDADEPRSRAAGSDEAR